jgi:hypothetical protein
VPGEVLHKLGELGVELVDVGKDWRMVEPNRRFESAGKLIRAGISKVQENVPIAVNVSGSSADGTDSTNTENTNTNAKNQNDNPQNAKTPEPAKSDEPGKSGDPKQSDSKSSTPFSTPLGGSSAGSTASTASFDAWVERQRIHQQYRGGILIYPHMLRPALQTFAYGLVTFDFEAVRMSWEGFSRGTNLKKWWRNRNLNKQNKEANKQPKEAEVGEKGYGEKGGDSDSSVSSSLPLSSSSSALPSSSLLSSGAEVNKMSWKLLAAAGPKIERFCFRDIDSRISTREYAAVKEWVESGREFHIMRDHPSHCASVMSGGMWCGRRGIPRGAASTVTSDMLALLKQRAEDNFTWTEELKIYRQWFWRDLILRPGIDFLQNTVVPIVGGPTFKSFVSSGLSKIKIPKNLSARKTQSYREDVKFLSEVIWPRIVGGGSTSSHSNRERNDHNPSSVLIHDSFNCESCDAGGTTIERDDSNEDSSTSSTSSTTGRNDNPEIAAIITRPFPTPRNGSEHVGAVFIDGKMRDLDVEVLRKEVEIQNEMEKLGQVYRGRADNDMSMSYGSASRDSSGNVETDSDFDLFSPKAVQLFCSVVVILIGMRLFRKVGWLGFGNPRKS